jgi:hypothetical protein
MAHFAEVDENDIVLRVLVVGNDQEHRGQEFLADDLGLGGTWVQTSYNGNMRKNYAGIGMKFDRVRDAFIPEQPYPSWVLNEETCLWDAPTPMPVEEGKMFEWVEADLNWQEVVLP